MKERLIASLGFMLPAFAAPLHAQDNSTAAPNPTVPASGAVGFRLSVDEEGKPTHCVITESSGHAELDTKTCDIMLNRARFKPKLDKHGEPIKSEFNSRIIFKIEN